MKKLINIGKTIAEEIQKRVDAREQEYVVALKRNSDDSIIGYHQSTMCSITDDILAAKRYDANGDLADQLKTIQNNYDTMLQESDFTGLFGQHFKNVQETYFKGIEVGQFYLDPVFLEEGTEKQTFKATIIP